MYLDRSQKWLHSSKVRYEFYEEMEDAEKYDMLYLEYIYMVIYMFCSVDSIFSFFNKTCNEVVQC
jgi:hypothetical protein